MALSVLTNVESLSAQGNLAKTQKALSATMGRLASGLRINSAGDDAAGLAIYGSLMQKTTIYVDEGAYRRLKQLARDRRRPPAELVREAIVEYTARHAPRRKPRSIGAFKSGRRDLGQRAEALLAAFGHDR